MNTSQLPTFFGALLLTSLLTIPLHASYYPNELEQGLCVICERSYPHEQLWVHTLECINNHSEETQQYECASCSKVFQEERSALRCQFKHDHEEKIMGYIEKNDQEQEVRAWQCSLCRQKEFGALEEIEDHLTSHQSEEEPTRCPFPSCRKNMSSPHAVLNHITRKHTAFYKYRCTYPDCNYTGQRDNIFSHVVTHLSRSKKRKSVFHLSSETSKKATRSSSPPKFIPVPIEKQMVIETLRSQNSSVNQHDNPEVE